MARGSAEAAAAAARGSALRFIGLLGIVSLFADMTYEGARSATGPFLLTLGAGPAVVGLIAGAGELAGYAVRLWSGYLADRTARYWLLTGLGYAINVLAVPALALAGRWQLAAALVLLERVGKAIRTPSRDVMLAHASRQVGTGLGFGLHEALDQIGAVAGPLLVAAAVWTGGDYRRGFAWLAVPALLALAALAAARLAFPEPAALEPAEPTTPPRRPLRSPSEPPDAPEASGAASKPGAAPVVSTSASRPAVAGTAAEAPAASVGSGPAAPHRPAHAPGLDLLLPPALRTYLAFVAVSTLGFMPFLLVALHPKPTRLVSEAAIPLLFAAAMAVDAVAALVAGRTYDRRGLTTLLGVPVATAAAAPLVLGRHPAGAVAGVLLWGVALGMQESILRAAVAGLVPAGARGRAYGLFHAVFGLAWFAGSALMGLLYGRLPGYAAAFAAGTQLVALPLWWHAVKATRHRGQP